MKVLEQVRASLELSDEEFQKVDDLISQAETIADRASLRLDEQAVLGLVAHLASLIRRLAAGELVSGVDATMFDEVPVEYRTMARELIEPLFAVLGRDVDLTEVGLIALHYAAARERAESETTGGN